MKTILAILMLVQSFIVYSMMMDPGPAPKTVLAHAFTETEIKTQIAMEKVQRQYAQAEKAVVAVITRHGCSDQFAFLAAQVAVDYRVPARILAATMVSESSCRSWVISATGDVGLMQVNARIHHLSVKKLLDPAFNVRVGGRILANCIHQFGLVEGLHHYNGLGNPTNAYAARVLKVAGYPVPNSA